jgi:hypothetical protein
VDDAGVSPQARLDGLIKLAAETPPGSVIHLSLVWENEHGSAGVASEGEGVRVFLHGADKDVESLAEAARLLRGIFSDQIVKVSGYSRDQLVYLGLADANDVSAGFNTLDTPALGDMPSIDEVMIETWSRGLEEA